MFGSDFLKIVRCPESGSMLAPADDTLIDRVNELIREGVVTNRADETITEPLAGGLFNEERSLLFPMRDQIVTLVPDQAIDVASLRL